MSTTPISMGLAADGALRRWCLHCQQNTWQIQLPKQDITLKLHGGKTRIIALPSWYCERCGSITG